MKAEVASKKNKDLEKHLIWVVLDKLKNYLSLIIFIPTLLGGLWQVIVLYQFGLSYIRFFSISQLLSDGLIILFFLPFLILFVVIIYSLIPELKNDIIRKRKGFLIFTLIPLVIFYFYALFYKRINFLNEGYRAVLDAILGIISLFCSLILFTISNRFSPFYWHEKKQDYQRKKAKDNDFKIINRYRKLSSLGFFSIRLSFFSFIFFIGFSLVALLRIGEYGIPENLLNTKYVIKTVEEKYKINSTNFEIAYYNDKYIFIRHYQFNKDEREKIIKNNLSRKISQKITIPKKILVIKSDAFFE